MAAYGNMDKAAPGLLDGLHHQIDSRLAKGAVEFGAVVFGTGDGEQVTSTGEGAPLGIASRTDTDAPKFLDKTAVNVVRSGKVWAPAAEAVNADSEVSVNASQGQIIAKTSAADGAKRIVTVTVSGTSATDKKASVTIGDQIFAVTTSDDVKTAAQVAAALQATIAAASTGFVATVSNAVVTLTAEKKGVSNVAIVAATNDGTQTLTVAQSAAGSDNIVNPGWYARTGTDAPGLVLVDLN